MRVVYLPGRLPDDAALNFAILQKLGVSLLEVREDDLSSVTAAIDQANVIVDALYGTGFHGAVTGLPAALLIAMNAAGKPVVSVDLPSGVDADTARGRGRRVAEDPIAVALGDVRAPGCRSL